MVTLYLNGCPTCGRENGAPPDVCAACGRVVALRRAVAPLWRALERSDEEATTLAVARALARIGGLSVASGLREWLLPRIPSAICPGAWVELLGELPDAEARAAAARIARENVIDQKLAGRWEVVLAGLPTAEARRALIAALDHEEETVRWAVIHAMRDAWEAAPAEAAPALRRLLMDETASGEIQFCAAVLLTRMNDPELGAECAVGLAEAIEEAEGSLADSLAEPTIAAAALALASDGELAAGARRFLMRRLEGGSEAILRLALPPLLARPTQELVDALIAGCLGRRPCTPSATTFARAFRGLQDPALRVYAWERLRHLIGEGEPETIGGVGHTLVQALGHLGHAEARPLLETLARRADDPLLLEAVREAKARLGDPGAIDTCAELLLAAGDEQEWDRTSGVPADRAASAAEVLGEIADAQGRARAVAPLLRALEAPRLTRHAAVALAALHAWEPVPAATAPDLRSGTDARLAPEAAPALLPVIEEPVEAALATQTAASGGTPASVGATSAATASMETAPYAIPQPGAPNCEAIGDRQPPLSSPAVAAVAAVLADLEREVARFPLIYFRYGGEVGTHIGKERVVMAMLCEELQPAIEQLERLGDAPEVRHWAARAWHLKARLHHALTCDPVARSGADALRQRQRWDQLKLAEVAYWRALACCEDDDRRARTLFDLGVLLAEAERVEEAAPLFEQVVGLSSGAPKESGAGRLASAARRYLDRLCGTAEPEPAPQSAPVSDDWTGAIHVARRALRTALVSAGGLAACGIFAWYAWTAAPKPAPPTKAIARRPMVIAQLEVTREQAKVRVHRTRRSAKVKTAQRGERLTAIGREDHWWKVQFPNGVTGWIPTRYTRPVE